MAIKWITPDWDAPPFVKALTTCRPGGVSLPPYESLNLGNHVGDCPLAVEKNRSLVKAACRLQNDPAWIQQVHGTNVIDAKEAVVAKTDASTSPAPPEADASFTQEKGIVCAVLTADCLPILLCHPKKPWVAAIHAGWPGLSSGVVDATVKRLPKEDRAALLAWLGPAIGPKAFQVKRDVIDQFEANGFTIDDTVFVPDKTRGHFLGNLYALARQRLLALGLKDNQITGGNYCTVTQSADFYSYRRDKVTGRMASLIWLS